MIPDAPGIAGSFRVGVDRKWWRMVSAE